MSTYCHTAIKKPSGKLYGKRGKDSTAPLALCYCRNGNERYYIDNALQLKRTQGNNKQKAPLN